MGREEYREVYLRSEHWRTVRIGALERAEHRCQVCNTTKQLDVHHRTYERLGMERDADLTVLCRRCHDTFHGNQKARPAKTKRKRTSKPKVVHAPVYVSPSERERYDKMRAAELERRREVKAERQRQRQEIERRRRENARNRDWRDERALPRKAA
jgi:hypothetical protein